MPSMTAFTENIVLDALLRGVPLVTPGIWFVALVTTEGGSNALAGVEVSGGSYARVPIPATLAAWAGTQGQGSTGESIGLGGNTSNNLPILFPGPTSNWGQIVGYEIWDQPTNGNRWFYDALSVPKTVSVGDPAPDFPAGVLGMQFI